MMGVEMALGGLFGGFAVEGLDLYTAVRRRGCWPWRTGEPREASLAAYALAEFVRLAIGAGPALAAATSGQVTTPVAALAVGLSAALVVERLARAIPVEARHTSSKINNLSADEETQPPGEPDATPLASKRVAMRSDSFTSQFLAALSRRTPAFTPPDDEPQAFPGRAHAPRPRAAPTPQRGHDPAGPSPLSPQPGLPPTAFSEPEIIDNPAAHERSSDFPLAGRRHRPGLRRTHVTAALALLPAINIFLVLLLMESDVLGSGPPTSHPLTPPSASHPPSPCPRKITITSPNPDTVIVGREGVTVTGITCNIDPRNEYVWAFYTTEDNLYHPFRRDPLDVSSDGRFVVTKRPMGDEGDRRKPHTIILALATQTCNTALLDKFGESDALGSLPDGCDETYDVTVYVTRLPPTP